MTTITTTTTTTTRPCRDGDVLWRAEVPCGAYATITVAERTPHPGSGTSAPMHHAYIQLECGIPRPTSSGIIQAAHDEDVEVAGESLRWFWGWSCGGAAHSIIRRTVGGGAYAALVATYSAELLADLTTIQGVVDRHHASVAAYESACEAAAAAWPVVDVGA